MTTKEYNEACLRSAMSDEEASELLIKRLQEDPTLAQTLHGIVGIGTEGGEILDNFKRHWMYGKVLDKPNILEECGDLIWYINVTLRSNGFTLEQAMEHNVEKLKKRYPNKFNAKDALERKDKINESPCCAFCKGNHHTEEHVIA